MFSIGKKWKKRLIAVGVVVALLAIACATFPALWGPCLAVKAVRAFLPRMDGAENRLTVRHVGLGGIEAVGKNEKVRHRAEFGVSVLRPFWNNGIGHALLDSCIECAKKAGYAQLELTVVSENAAALALYLKAGFTECGRNPKGFCSRLTGDQETVQLRLEL